ncbi:MAG: hypothetical protein CMJ29_12605 [Phycisphaerae bacterium]|nr:hypothetical protein [Phycisphaerae bacterium]
MAILAMVIACLPCPPVSLLGSVIGLMAIGRIRQADGKLRGLTLAKISIVVGILMSVSSLFLLTSLRDYLEDGQRKAISESVQIFLTESLNDNASGALSHWDLKESPVHVEDVVAFATVVHDRLGSLKSLQIGKIDPAKDVSMLQPRLDAWLILEFDQGTRNASCQFVLVPVLGSMSFGTRITSLKIEDPDGGLIIPVEDGLPVETPPVETGDSNDDEVSS